MNIACSRWPGSRERMSERVSASQVRRFVGVGGRAPEIQARWWAICRRHRCNLRRNGRPLLALDDDEAESPLYAPRPANSSQLLKFNHTTFSLIHTLPTHSFIHSFFLHQLVDAVRCRPPAIVSRSKSAISCPSSNAMSPFQLPSTVLYPLQMLSLGSGSKLTVLEV